MKLPTFKINWKDFTHLIYVTVICNKCKEETTYYDADAISFLISDRECLMCKFKVQKVKSKWC
jgi:hypothetical protein